MSATNQEGTVFDGTKKVTVYSTEKDVQHETGSPIEVGVLAAEDLIKNGFACKTKADAEAWEGDPAPTASELKARKMPKPKTAKK